MSRSVHAAAAAALRRHRTPADGRPDIVTLVHYATLAASSHNTQPWTFEAGADCVWVSADFSRRCPAVDPDDHHLFASLGCATENLLLAAQAFGYGGTCAWDAATSRIRIDFASGPATRSALFDAIPLRQCTRSLFDGKALSTGDLRSLEGAAAGNGVSVLMITDAGRRRSIADYVAAGNDAQFPDRAWADELRSWIRFNAKEAIRSGDGLYGPVMGSPDVPRWLGRLAMRVAFSARKQNRKDLANILGSSAIAIIHSDANDRVHWVEAGRCYQRLALQATAMGLCTAFINQPVEVAALRPQFASFLGIGARRPDLVVRIGRGPAMPASLRRPVSAVLV